ncbi:MAG: hypothetical protein IJI10_03495 [Eubacterium sp.]|nr:hypothetical protein [Eubacterium sp.]
MMEKQRKRLISGEYLKRASMTVESAVIVPMAVVLLALLIVLTFYVHNRTWYICAACEAAVRGNMPVAEGSHEAEDSARKLAQQRITDQVMPGSDPSLDISVGKKSTSVQYAGQTYVMFSRYLTPFRVQLKADQVRPETFVRTLWSGGGYHAD